MSDKAPYLRPVPDLPPEEADPSKPNDEGKITGIPTPESMDPRGVLVEQPVKQIGIPRSDSTAADLGPQFDDPEQGSEEASVRNHPSNPPPRQ